LECEEANTGPKERHGFFSPAMCNLRVPCHV
jgi:hypothetical protein